MDLAQLGTASVQSQGGAAAGVADGCALSAVDALTGNARGGHLSSS